jgi:hypothetical protein
VDNVILYIPTVPVQSWINASPPARSKLPMDTLRETIIHDISDDEKQCIPKNFATPSLLSQITTSKYQYALPLYRQESMFKQYGIGLSRQTMSSWALKCAEIFKPLYRHLHQVLLQQRVIHADETTVNVLASEK